MRYRTTKTEARRLLVINFVTDANDPILGFAVDWIGELAKSVDQLVVLTGHLGQASLPQNVEVVCTGWQEDQNIRNVFRLLRQLVRVLHSFKPHAAFTHMAAVQGLVAAPLLFLCRTRHVLWYTHFQPTKELRLLTRFVNSVVTAGPGTFPIDTPKKHVIGHGIKDFDRYAIDIFANEFDFIHWGRCDPSKRLDYIAESVDRINGASGRNFVVKVIGQPSKGLSEEHWAQTLANDRDRSFPVLRWEGPVDHDLLPGRLLHPSVFLHASTSGLDKAPLEASMMGVPVLSENPSVQKALGDSDSSGSLFHQIEAFIAMTAEQRQNLADFQRAAVAAQHSIDTLGERLVQFLFPGDGR